MFSENEENVLMYRENRTVAKAPTHNEKKAGQNVNVLRDLFQLYTRQQIATVFRKQIYLPTYSRGATHDFRSVCTSP